MFSEGGKRPRQLHSFFATILSNYTPQMTVLKSRVLALLKNCPKWSSGIVTSCGKAKERRDSEKRGVAILFFFVLTVSCSSAAEIRYSGFQAWDTLPRSALRNGIVLFSRCCMKNRNHEISKLFQYFMHEIWNWTDFWVQKKTFEEYYFCKDTKVC